MSDNVKIDRIQRVSIVGVWFVFGAESKEVSRWTKWVTPGYRKGTIHLLGELYPDWSRTVLSPAWGAGVESPANGRRVCRWARTGPNSNSGVGKAMPYSFGHSWPSHFVSNDKKRKIQTLIQSKLSKISLWLT